MADVQTENGFTRVANELLNEIVRFKFNGTELRIILTIWRYTYGFQRKQHDLSTNFLAEAIGIDNSRVKKVVKELIERKVIHVIEEATFSKSRVLSFNKKYNEWDVGNDTRGQNLPHRYKTTPPQGSNTTPPQGSNKTPKKESIKDNYKDIPSSAELLFKHYQSKGIINHKNMNGPMVSAANARLKDYSFEQLRQAIDNYAKIYSNDDYWFNAKYAFADLMRDKDIRKFIDDADPLVKFRKNDVPALSVQSQEPLPAYRPFNSDLTRGED